MAEKCLVRLEIGETSGIHITHDTSKTTKEALSFAFQAVMVTGLKQGFLTGDESTIEQILNKLK